MTLMRKPFHRSPSVIAGAMVNPPEPQVGQWWDNWRACLAYKAEYKRWPPAVSRLGQWLLNQRRKAKKPNALLPDRILAMRHEGLLVDERLNKGLPTLPRNVAFLLEAAKPDSGIDAADRIRPLNEVRQKYHSGHLSDRLAKMLLDAGYRL